MPNQIPLTLGAPGYPSTYTPSTAAVAELCKLDPHATASPQGFVRAAMRKACDGWMKWAKVQAEHGSMSRADREKPALLNRFDRYSAQNWRAAYPGDPNIYLPNQLPGRNPPAAFIGND